MKQFSIIVAAGFQNGIGQNGSIPWKEKEDMRFFRNMTTNTIDGNKVNAVIMGRATFESLNETPLKNRINVVITSNKNYVDAPPNLLFARSLDHALTLMRNTLSVERIFIIGGQRLYEEAIVHPHCQYIYMNKIHHNGDYDTFFPEIDCKIFNLVDTIVLNKNVVAYMYVRQPCDKVHNKKIDL